MKSDFSFCHCVAVELRNPKPLLLTRPEERAPLEPPSPVQEDVPDRSAAAFSGSAPCSRSKTSDRSVALSDTLDARKTPLDSLLF